MNDACFVASRSVGGTLGRVAGIGGVGRRRQQGPSSQRERAPLGGSLPRQHRREEALRSYERSEPLGVLVDPPDDLFGDDGVFYAESDDSGQSWEVSLPAEVCVPRPSIVPSFHSPSYRSRFAYIARPRPSRMPARHWPSYLSPLA